MECSLVLTLPFFSEPPSLEDPGKARHPRWPPGGAPSVEELFEFMQIEPSSSNSPTRLSFWSFQTFDLGLLHSIESITHSSHFVFYPWCYLFWTHSRPLCHRLHVLSVFPQTMSLNDLLLIVYIAWPFVLSKFEAAISSTNCVVCSRSMPMNCWEWLSLIVVNTPFHAHIHTHADTSCGILSNHSPVNEQFKKCSICSAMPRRNGR